MGRPISDIKPDLLETDLAQLIAQVIDSLNPLERDVQNKKGHWYSLRIRPYVTLDSVIDGASIVLLDIDSLKKALEEARLKKEEG
jgi:two-component system CheB/CheR fusion protein